MIMDGELKIHTVEYRPRSSRNITLCVLQTQRIPYSEHKIIHLEGGVLNMCIKILPYTQKKNQQKLRTEGKAAR